MRQLVSFPKSDENSWGGNPRLVRLIFGFCIRLSRPRQVFEIVDF